MKTTVNRLAVAAMTAVSVMWGLNAAAEGLKVGDPMPMKDYQMKNVDGTVVTTEAIAGQKATVVAFWCNHCPFVVKSRQRFIDIVKAYQGDEVGFVAVNSNDPTKVPGDSFEAMQKIAKEFDYPFPFTVDEGAKLAAVYGAKLTPHIFVFDGDLNLVYIGAIDDNPDAKKATKPYLKQTLDALLAGEAVPTPETKAFGCTIKWPK